MLRRALSVRETLRGKHILLIGVTGFIGKVWLAQLLTDVPEIGKIYLLIRRQRTTTAQRRFEKSSRSRRSSTRWRSATATSSRSFCASESKSSKAT